MEAPTHNLQALIFDFDGVIVDSESLHWEAFCRVLKPLGLGMSWDEYQQAYIGYDDRGVFQRVHETQGRSLSDTDRNALIEQKAQAFIQLAESASLEPYPGVIALIGEAAARGPVGLCTGALASDIDPILKSLGLAQTFTARVTADEVAASKPDPESYKRLLEKLGASVDRPLNPRQCLAIEDTPAGIAAAQGIGLRVAAVTNSCSRSVLSPADWIIDSLAGVSMDTLDDWLSAYD